MKKISDAVREKVNSDQIAYEAIRSGLLNLSAYAQSIRKEIEEITWKEVKVSTIVVSLSRLAKELSSAESLYPDFKLDDLTIRSPLIDVSYVKNKENLEGLRRFQKELQTEENSFFMITQSVREITVILTPDYKQLLFANIPSQPKEIFDNLVGITISFSPEYLSIPNIIYTVVVQLALARINIREIVSTYTELSIIIDKKDMDRAINALQVFSK